MLTHTKIEPGAFRQGFPEWTLSGLYGVDFMLRRGGAILTDRTDLCEKLVWHTRHPYRHKRDPARVGQRALPEHADPSARGRMGERRVG